MNIREQLNNSPAVVTIGAVVLLIICLALIIWQLTPSTRTAGPQAFYYYDLNTGKLFVHKVEDYTDQPPIASPTDSANAEKPHGVWAHVYACGSCPGDLNGLTVDKVKAKGAWIRYIERMTLEAKDQLRKAKEKQKNSDNPGEGYAPDLYMQGRMVKSVKHEGQGGWFNVMSPQAAKIRSRDRDRCSGDENPKECFPKG